MLFLFLVLSMMFLTCVKAAVHGVNGKAKDFGIVVEGEFAVVYENVWVNFCVLWCPG